MSSDTPSTMPGRGSLFDLTYDEAKAAVLSRNWWLVVLRGIFGIVFGLVAFLVPGAALLSLVIFFAIYLLADGIAGIVASVRAARQNERWGMLLLEGILSVAVGILALLVPLGTVLAFVIMIAAWALLTGGLMLASAFKLSGAHGRWWMALGGIVSIVFGVLLAIAPFAGAVVLTWWIGAYALVFGVMLLILGFQLRSRKDRPTGEAARA